MTKKTRNWLIIGGIIVIIGALIAYSASNRKSAIEYTTADVTRGTLIQTVSETGTITPAKEVELNFTTSGQLVSLAVKVGDKVKPNQAIGQIDSSNLSIRQQEANASLNVSQASVAQAQGNYDSAKREYDKLSTSLKETLAQAEKTKRDLEERGSKTITTSEQAISTAQSNLAATQTTYRRAIDNKSAALMLTINSKLSTTATALDAADRILTDDYARAGLGHDNSYALRQTRTAYTEAVSLLNQAKSAAAKAKADPSADNVKASYDSIQIATSRSFDMLNLLFTVLRASITTTDFTQAELDAFKVSVDGQLASISAVTTALQTARQAYDDATLAYDTNVLTANQNVSQAEINYENALTTARNAVASATANRDQQLATAQSRVDSTQANLSVVTAQVGQALANVALIRDQIADNTLKSPIIGTITKLNYQVGEQVTPQKALLSVLTENNFQLEVDIAETDISKIKTGNVAEVTLDSFGDNTKFNGSVYFIDPAETIIQGVTYYKVKVSFDPGKLAVKPGMTANAVITTDQRDDVLMMPARAVVDKDGKKIVRILENDVPREVEVSVGLSGDDGLVEVISGVKEGDKVVTFLKDTAKK